MNRLPFAPPPQLLIALVAICLAASAARAQDPAANQAPAAAAPQPAQPARPAAQPAPNPDNAWMAKANKLYYSSTRAGLTGFDCTIHPDWHTVFVSANKGKTVADDDAGIALLKTVNITLHARMSGGSTIDWVAPSSPDKPLDKGSTDLLDGMHQGIQQVLEGFMQFWTPFVDGSAVPDSAEGLEITHTPTVHTIHVKQGDTEVTEILSKDLVLEQFNVTLKGASIKVTPAYKPTAQGLLVNGFVAHILPAGAAPSQAQDMTVGIEYQALGGLTIPRQVNIDVVGSGTFNLALDSCTTNPKPN
jgi:hypothetical protein